MFAIVDIQGQQFKVEKDNKIFVHRLPEKEGERIFFEKVLLMNDKGAVRIGKPIIEGEKITARVIAHVKGDKVHVFKKKRRKGYKTHNGHRQQFTQIKIEEINVLSAKVKVESPSEKKTETKTKLETENKSQVPNDKK